MYEVIKLIRKRDYSDTYTKIIRELNSRGFRKMANYLETNPPEKTYMKHKGGYMLGVDVAQRLEDAKEYAGGSIVLSELKTIQGPEFENLRIMLVNKEKQQDWQDKLRRDE